MNDDDIVIDLSDTYTTYIADGVITDTTFNTSGTITITSDGLSSVLDLGDYTYNNITLGESWIDPEQVSKMCKQYPALEKAWRNFKSVYDMVKQDYEGKKKAGEIDDDDIPF